MKTVLVSACLLGFPVRYDGGRKPASGFLPQDAVPVPVCPEIFGGLPTPRPASEIPEGSSGSDVLDGTASVFSVDGADVTAAFLRGARMTLDTASLVGAKDAFLKSRSPSCDSLFGVAAALLARNGVTVHPVE
ncbi:MAG: DUF523 domain-containing protein [Planctomycetes bacterium]|nr:DUF523 domain-containing protein [Planctomycetota bacterium]